MITLKFVAHVMFTLPIKLIWLITFPFYVVHEWSDNFGIVGYREFKRIYKETQMRRNNQ